VQWCFEADYCGLAASLYGLVRNEVLDEKDIDLANGIGSLKTNLGKYNKIFEELMNF
jgi:hypothetical protein